MASHMNSPYASSYSGSGQMIEMPPQGNAEAGPQVRLMTRECDYYHASNDPKLLTSVSVQSRYTTHSKR